ncbi:MAG: hypothetical protein H7Y59_03965 [Anaerolineales bacterium]|nr:hypothetical protein [Anaerolineales bacterium]
MRRWFLVLIVGIFFIFPSITSAQTGVIFSNVNVQFWPEYDKAEMLVINYITLSPETSLPSVINLKIPADVENPLVVAVGPSLDEVTDQGVQFSTKVDNNWLVVSIQATGHAIQLEYYDPSLKKDGSSRSYHYEWLNDYIVQNFIVTVQQPFDASKLKTSPALQSDGVHSDKLQYYQADFGAIAISEKFSFDLSYEKRSDVFSISQLTIEPVNISEDTPGRMSFSNTLPYLLVGMGVAIIVGGFAYYWGWAGRGTSKKSRRRARAQVEEESAEESYCPQCGARAKSGDRFCRVCGGRIRHQEE